MLKRLKLLLLILIVFSLKFFLDASVFLANARGARAYRPISDLLESRLGHAFAGLEWLAIHNFCNGAEI